MNSDRMCSCGKVKLGLDEAAVVGWMIHTPSPDQCESMEEELERAHRAIAVDPIRSEAQATKARRRLDDTADLLCDGSLVHVSRLCAVELERDEARHDLAEVQEGWARDQTRLLTASDERDKALAELSEARAEREHETINCQHLIEASKISLNEIARLRASLETIEELSEGAAKTGLVEIQLAVRAALTPFMTTPGANP